MQGIPNTQEMLKEMEWQICCKTRHWSLSKIRYPLYKDTTNETRIECYILVLPGDNTFDFGKFDSGHGCSLVCMKLRPTMGNLSDRWSCRNIGKATSFRSTAVTRRCDILPDKGSNVCISKESFSAILCQPSFVLITQFSPKESFGFPITCDLSGRRMVKLRSHIL
jgi:hypothetical protein